MGRLCRIALLRRTIKISHTGRIPSKHSNHMKPSEDSKPTASVETARVGCSAGLGPVFRIEEVTRKTRLRWFLRRGATTYRERGFRNKQQVCDWIESLGERIDWRVGFVFRLKGDDCEMSFVNRNGRTPAEHRGQRRGHLGARYAKGRSPAFSVAHG